MLLEPSPEPSAEPSPGVAGEIAGLSARSDEIRQLVSFRFSHLAGKRSGVQRRGGVSGLQKSRGAQDPYGGGAGQWGSWVA